VRFYIVFIIFGNKNNNAPPAKECQEHKENEVENQESTKLKLKVLNVKRRKVQTRSSKSNQERITVKAKTIERVQSAKKKCYSSQYF
jgi:hypothetical protein